jgi:hypothetical protein
VELVPVQEQEAVPGLQDRRLRAVGRVCAGKGGSGTCRACSRCRGGWRRTPPTGAWPSPRRKRPGADAYQAAERLFDPASPAHHPVVACWLIGDLAEAALYTGRIDEARARVKQVEAASGDVPGTCIAIGLRHARALLAQDPSEAGGRFDEALGADLGHWPVQRARLLLAYGQWLRRQRRIADSRPPGRPAAGATCTPVTS